MRYEQTKKLSNREFKRLVGVQRLTFAQMVKVMGDTTQTKQTRGCPPKLDLEDQVLICLQYWREYRTYFHIAGDWSGNIGVSPPRSPLRTARDCYQSSRSSLSNFPVVGR
ncbi:hypothetical protein B4U84_25980 [Westiellopsis prolifica IICB1]|nr:hypothetical protein B4U84_25980 [Westiellopsis prolifica IICB1]